jgi:iron(III) transport system ATP-binding protein
MISITIQGFSKRFGSTTALDRIDLKIDAGEIFFLLGPSGCGKTTLLRSIAGFYLPDAGRILFDEEDVSNVPPHLRNTGMMFQSYALWPHLTVAGNIAFGLEERRIAKAEITRRVEEALASVHLEGLGDRRIPQLSGGQQQRVALARALVIRPRCLLLDEPLSNLDAKLRLEMRGEIRRICREAGLTAVYVTHDQKEALSIADRMAVLHGGRLLQVGDPSTVYRRPESRFVADFMGETNFLEGRIASLSGNEATVETPLGPFLAQVSSSNWAPGSPVTLSIRPESWKLSETSSSSNTVSGRISDRIYLGELAQYAFTPAATSAAPLKVLELNPRFVHEDANKDFYATVSAEDVVVLPPKE